MPIWQKDLNFIQNAPKEILLALIAELGLDVDDFIITGCQITIADGTIAMTSGLAYYNGEILPVQAMTATAYTGTPRIKLDKVTNYNSEGARNFVANNSSTIARADVWQDDYLIGAVITSSYASTYRLAITEGAWTLVERIQKRVLQESNWVEVQNTSTHVGRIKYKRVGKLVQVKGSASNDATGTGLGSINIASALPIPASGATRFPAIESGTTSIIITATGAMNVITTSDTVVLNHIIYMSEFAYDGSNDGHYSTLNNSGSDDDA
ncbi:MAG: hypothetical protein PHR20_02240 [Bacteroidales bacterium]|nr:hypothetical protein [Bacteroidales bacterium]